MARVSNVACKSFSSFKMGSDMSTKLNVFIALAAGFILANLYYTQTIIADIGHSLQLDESARGIIVTMAQLGYATGLLLLVPLGDKVENKKLITTLVFTLLLTLIICGLVESGALFLPGIYLVGLCTCVVQIIVPYGASLATPEKQGRAVGIIASGAILGIVMARPAASFLTGMFSWRFCFFMSAFFMLVIGLAFMKALPKREAPTNQHKYGEITRSLVGLLISEPELRKRAFPMALVFSGFAMFWASSPLALRDQLSFSQQKIALLALVSLGAPICTMAAGRLADRGLGFITAVVGIVSTSAAFLITPVWGLSTGLFVFSALFLDCGTHTAGMINQQAVLALDSRTRSRLNAIYVSIMFCGGAVGSALGPWLYSHYSWKVTALTGFGINAVALIMYLADHLSNPGSYRAR